MADTLTDLREHFRDTDRKILALLARRCALSRRMAMIKQAHGMPIVQRAVWQKQLLARQREGQIAGLDPRFTAALFNLLHDESVRIQKHKIESTK